MTEPIKSLLGPRKTLLLCLVYTAVITILFLIPGKKLPQSDWPFDKVVHILMNAVLTFLWIGYALFVSSKAHRKRMIVLTVLLCVIYGIIIEALQEIAVPLRQADVWDLAANVVGIILGIVISYRFKNIFVNES